MSNPRDVTPKRALDAYPRLVAALKALLDDIEYHWGSPDMKGEERKAEALLRELGEL